MENAKEKVKEAYEAMLKDLETNIRSGNVTQIEQDINNVTMEVGKLRRIIEVEDGKF